MITNHRIEEVRPTERVVIADLMSRCEEWQASSDKWRELYFMRCKANGYARTMCVVGGTMIGLVINLIVNALL